MRHNALKSSGHPILPAYLVPLVLLVLILASSGVYGQNQKEIIQFSGVVVDEDSTSTGLFGVHVYVPKAGRGTVTNRYGYFSLPVLEGDSVMISAVGYQKQHFIIPGDEGDSFTVLVELATDTTILSTVEIFPYPTEELFKEAILALNLPIDDDNQEDNLGQEVLARMAETMTMDASQNYKYYMNQQFYQLHNSYSQQRFNNPLLNPINWASFIKSLRRGDLKKKK
ncbi:MAG: hypothetical protein DHS20C17_30450 [Cyclobacteriaceae bacterium]|nr:MAG: hypothetical protein DHS20C17_30450 [Cyclobacteriaceae bacterium]